MANSTDLSSAVIELLQNSGKDMHAAELVAALGRSGYNADQAVRGLRAMLNSGAIGLGPEMNIRLIIKQYA